METRRKSRHPSGIPIPSRVRQSSPQASNQLPRKDQILEEKPKASPEVLKLPLENKVTDSLQCNKKDALDEDEDFCTENISVKAAVRMFGGEAKIRKLPPPDGARSKVTECLPPRNVLSSKTGCQNNDSHQKDVDLNSAKIMDYTIRGTISPLSGNHDNGSVGQETDRQISFVFGRPLSPESRPCPSSNDSKIIRRNSTSSRYKGRNSKPPIYIPPSSNQDGVNCSNKSVRVPYSVVVGDSGYIGLQCCEQCKICLADLKRQALQMMSLEDNQRGRGSKNFTVERIEEKLKVPESCVKLKESGHCDVCDTDAEQLKKEAVAMVQSIQQAQIESPIPAVNHPPQSSVHNGNTRGLKLSQSLGNVTTSIPGPTHIYLDQQYSRNNWKKTTLMLTQQKTNASNNNSREKMSNLMENAVIYAGSPHTMNMNHNRQMNMQPNQNNNLSMQTGHHVMQPGYTQYHLHQMQYVHQNQQNRQHQSPQIQQSYSAGPVYKSHQPYSSPQAVPGSPYRGHQSIGSPHHINQPGSESPHHSVQHHSSHFSQYGGSNYDSQMMSYSVPLPLSPPPHPMSPPPFSRVSSPGSSISQHSAAASFFARAAQKLGKKKKRHQQQEPDLPQFPTKFNEVIRLSPPPAPPCLFRAVGRMQQPGVGKVKVMLKICATGPHADQGQSCLSIDPRKKQVTVFDPSSVGITTSSHRRTTPVAPKMFAFDAVFSPDDSQTEICSSSLTEIIQGVVNGADGCLFSYGYSRLGKSFTMMGKDTSTQTLGVMPCAITWLFRLIDEQKEKTGARFSVRVSAVEVSGKNEQLKDLLAEVAKSTEAGLGTAPGVYLREDPICGTQLENQSELRAPTADRAAYYLDAALAARAQDEEELRSSHIVFTLHVYQYRIEKANQAGLPGVAGGRSRLHLIDLGSSSKSKDPDNVSLSLSALGNVIMALVNGQRHVPHRDSKVAQLLRDSLGNISCRTCMLAHVSSAVTHHQETLQVIQLAARIHRMRRRKTKFSSTSSDDSSTDDGRLRRPFRGFRMGTLREDMLYSSSHSDPDYTSSSEQSCDTVIYVGANGQSLSDREITDNEGPPRSVPRTNPRLPRRPSGSRSSGDEGSNSDSGRSRASSDFRYGRAALIQRESFNVNRYQQSPKAVPSVRDVSVVANRSKSPPMSPIGGSKLPHPLNVRTRPLVTKSDESGHKSNVKGHGSDHAQIAGEQWIDGPGANIYSQKKTVEEHWIDGPQAFVKQELVNKLDPANKHLFNPKMNAEEQWVDGPQEMIAGSQAVPRASYGKATVHSSCKAEKRGPSQERSSPKHGKSKPVQDVKERPDSTTSVDSNASLAVQGPDSRPTSLHENEKSAENQQNVTPFVRDWVEKHSAINEPSANKLSDVSNTLDCKHKRTKPENRRKLSASTPKHSPANSPSLVRKGKCESGTMSKLQKSHLPTPANPTKRVKDWIKSVSVEQGQSSCNNLVSFSEFEKNLHEGNSELNLSQDVSSCSSVHLDSTVEVESHCETTMNTAPCSSDGRPDEMAECNIGDISFDSSVDAGDIGNTCANNRESIYELQMDAQLEKSDSKSVADNDTFSSLSCKEDESDDDCEYEPLLAKNCDMPHSLTVESLKTLVAEPVEMSQENQTCQDCEKNYSKDNCYQNIYEKVKSPSSLLRKPDGASNPNLINELDYEGKIDVNYMRGEYIINQVQQMSSQFDCQKPTSVFNSCKNKLLEEESDISKKSKSKPPLPTKPSPRSVSASPSQQNIYKDLSLSPKSSSSYSSKNSSPCISVHASRSKEKSRQLSGSSVSSQYSLPLTSSPSSISTTKSNSAKSSKTQSPSSSKLPVFSNKNSRKKDKEYKAGNSRVAELNQSSSRGTDSDSGNDSGIVTHETKLLSPYSTVTKPRTPSHSSSGHGSDNSSTVSADIRSQLGIKDKLHGGTSSGYESMLRDSEASVTSSGQDDSNSEPSSDKKKGTKKKKSSTKRSRSAPARSGESPERKGSVNMTSPSPKAWVDTRQIQRIKEEPFEIKLYDMDDVERLGRRRAEDEDREQRKDQINVQGKQLELIDHRDQIVMEERNWSFDCRFLMCFCRSKPKQTDV